MSTTDVDATVANTATSSPRTPQADQPVPERMVLSRLGAYTGLFFALRAKHPPTATHSLRVALAASKWAAWRGMDNGERDLLEVACLLHDIGKIGVPDSILQKPGALNQEERLVMDSQARMAKELLSASGASEDLVAIIVAAKQFSASEFGAKNALDARVARGAAMLQILDAFDSMTNEQAFRKAITRDRALMILSENVGAQFDAEHVQDFAELVGQPRPKLELEVAKRWLNEVQDVVGFSESDLSGMAAQNSVTTEQVFHDRLLDGLRDGAIYLDVSGQILLWNGAAEQMSGKAASAVLNHRWEPGLLGLQELDGAAVVQGECPVAKVRASNAMFEEQYILELPHHSLPVALRALPVISKSRSVCGTILLIQDKSSESCLEERLQSLHTIATSDPLTKVANRAELDRQLPLFLDRHVQDCAPGSMIICDIDFFKRINDRFGHQAGDDALVTFAGLLRENARGEDLVARFGGEEFIILCSGCDTFAATARAEQIRKTVEKTPVPSLKGNCMTSSFGVTELQAGDTVETFMARADRALLKAKETGRNRVVDFGVGQSVVEASSGATPNDSPAKPANKNGWLGWFSSQDEPIYQVEYLVASTKDVLVQKLEGFLDDHQAEIHSSGSSSLLIRVNANPRRRETERPTSMLLQLDFRSASLVVAHPTVGQSYQPRMVLKVEVTPYKARDRRSDVLRSQAVQVLNSLKAYLVAQEMDDSMREKIILAR